MKSRTPVDRSKVRIKPSAASRAASLANLPKRIDKRSLRLSWCPVELRDEYRGLVRRRVPAIEARRIIEDHIKRRPK